MSNNKNIKKSRSNPQNERFFEKSMTHGEHRTEMLKLELLYQKIMKKYEV